MVANWSDSEGSNESESQDGQAHLCLMANDYKDHDLDKIKRRYLPTSTLVLKKN